MLFASSGNKELRRKKKEISLLQAAQNIRKCSCSLGSHRLRRGRQPNVCDAHLSEHVNLAAISQPHAPGRMNNNYVVLYVILEAIILIRGWRSRSQWAPCASWIHQNPGPRGIPSEQNLLEEIVWYIIVYMSSLLHRQVNPRIYKCHPHLGLHSAVPVSFAHFVTLPIETSEGHSQGFKSPAAEFLVSIWKPKKTRPVWDGSMFPFCMMPSARCSAR